MDIRCCVLIVALLPLGSVSAAQTTSVGDNTRTNMQSFEAAVCKAIEAKWLWPRNLFLSGALGSTIIDFVYFKGKVSDVKVVVSSGSTLMDKSFVRAMLKAKMPLPPTWMPMRPLPLKATLSEPLGDEKGVCSWSKISERRQG